MNHLFGLILMAVGFLLLWSIVKGGSPSSNFRSMIGR